MTPAEFKQRLAEITDLLTADDMDALVQAETAAHLRGLIMGYNAELGAPRSLLSMEALRAIAEKNRRRYWAVNRIIVSSPEPIIAPIPGLVAPLCKPPGRVKVIPERLGEVLTPPKRSLNFQGRNEYTNFKPPAIHNARHSGRILPAFSNEVPKEAEDTPPPEPAPRSLKRRVETLGVVETPPKISLNRQEPNNYYPDMPKTGTGRVRRRW